MLRDLVKHGSTCRAENRGKNLSFVSWIKSKGRPVDKKLFALGFDETCLDLLWW